MGEGRMTELMKRYEAETEGGRMNHTKEPWKADLRSGCCAIYPENKAEESNGCDSNHDRNICFSSKGNTYVEDQQGGYWDMDEQVRVDFKRIVACVNACEGITNEALEAGVVHSALINLEESLELQKGEQFCFYDIPVLEDV
jgi:hypothetical protein